MKGCVDMIQECWKFQIEGSRMFSFHKKLKHCREGLLQWRKKENTNSKAQIESIKKQVECMQEEEGSRDWETWHQLKAQLGEAYAAEEEFWSRKARIDCLFEGDKNT